MYHSVHVALPAANQGRSWLRGSIGPDPLAGPEATNEIRANLVRNALAGWVCRWLGESDVCVIGHTHFMHSVYESGENLQKDR